MANLTVNLRVRMAWWFPGIRWALIAFSRITKSVPSDGLIESIVKKAVSVEAVRS